jgi:phospholipid-binding lipoprotein MlaA
VKTGKIHQKEKSMIKSVSMSRFLAVCLLVPFLLMETGCASKPVAPQATDDLQENDVAINDPLEGFNRVIFKINDVLDHLLIRPAAVIYTNVVPAPVRRGVTNVLNNAWSPITLLNSVLQGDFNNAGHVAERFAINSTVGLAGIFDVAGKHCGIRAHSEDFGQTLGAWGAGPGFYLVLPILGPSSLRDGVGRGVDTLTNPITWIGGDYEWVKYVVAGGYILDYRANNLNTIDTIYDTSVDPYAAIRSLYLQRREADIKNGR